MVKRKIVLEQAEGPFADPKNVKPYTVIELTGTTEPEINAHLTKLDVDDLIRRPNTTVIIKREAGARR